MFNFFVPWYLRWIFKLPWFLYLIVAGIIGLSALTTLDTYRIERNLNEVQIAAGAPPSVPLSTWNPQSDVSSYGEVLVEGLYFDELPVGDFSVMGSERRFIVLPDEVGKEVKAVLVVRSSDYYALRRYLVDQNSGENYEVTVGGELNTSTVWAGQINLALNDLAVPRSENLLVIEPFIGDRVRFLSGRADSTRDTSEILATLAALFAAYAGVRFLMTRGRSRRKAAPRRTRAERRTREAQSTHPSPTAKPNPSPWGTSQPRPSQITDETTKNGPIKGAKKTGPLIDGLLSESEIPLEPKFKSVFPGGGSAFRFKSSDEIIRQYFGTLAILNKVKDRK